MHAQTLGKAWKGYEPVKVHQSFSDYILITMTRPASTGCQLDMVWRLFVHAWEGGHSAVNRAFVADCDYGVASPFVANYALVQEYASVRILSSTKFRRLLRSISVTKRIAECKQ